jgi:apolipoprotein D and lipocalin family protein
MKYLLVIFLVLLTGCVGIPDNVTPVDNFELERYLGIWHEIARLDHSFERGLSHVTAEYSMRDDGGVKVLNRGYSVEEDSWQEAVGKAYFAEDSDQGFLKVSFFGPFYGSYIIFELDHENYQYALVCGPRKSYLWILSRTPTLTEDIRSKLLRKAAAAGFEISELVFVNHENPPENPPLR